MQGIYIHGTRPTTKKAVKLAATTNPGSVRIEATSWFGNEYDGKLTEAPDGRYSFVGPDPHTSRKFYGTIVKSGTTIKVN